MVSDTSWNFGKVRARSHRRRLTQTVCLVFGAILAALFFIASTFYRQEEARSANTELDTVLRAISTELAVNPNFDDLWELARSPRGLSASIFQPNGDPWDNFGSLTLEPKTGRGLAMMNGILVRYASNKVKDRLVVVADNWQDVVDGDLRLNLMLLAIWFPLTALVGYITWATVTNTFKPLLGMAKEAGELSLRGPGSRLAVPEDAEFGPLAVQLNEFLDRLEANVRQQERFVQDAAHELRTPLTILRGQVETALLRERTPAEYASVLSLVLDEAVRMSSLIESLLVSSRSEMTPAPLNQLAVSVQEAVDRWRPRYAERGVHLKAEIHPAKATILYQEMDSILDNLLANALRHSPEGETCQVLLDSKAGHTVLKVSDRGTGIPDDLKEKIFERFYRTDTSRNREYGGFGIGLAICRRIIVERGGEILVEDNQPSGAVFVVRWTGRTRRPAN